MTDTTPDARLAIWGDCRLKCDHCGQHVDGRRGLLSHHSQVHPDLPKRAKRDPRAPGASDCCSAVVGSTPATDRPFCRDCGVILADNRVDGDDYGPDRDDWRGQF